MTRPADLRPVPLAEVLPMGAVIRGALYMTMSPGQWDAMLAVAYDEGWVLIEVDADERPVRAFRREEAAK